MPSPRHDAAYEPPGLILGYGADPRQVHDGMRQLSMSFNEAIQRRASSWPSPFHL